MTDFLAFVVVGLTSGSVYGIAGMGLVLTYKTSGIFNFAHGAVAAAAAYLFYELHELQGVPWPIAAVVCVVGFGAAAGVFLERIARTLRTAGVAAKVVATVGLLLAIQGAAVIRYGSEALNLPPFLPTRIVRVAGVNVGVDQLLVVLIAAVSAVSLYVLFRSARVGVAMRGVVDDADLLALQGTEPVAVRRWAWSLGSAFASLSGILIAPSLGLDAHLLTLLVVQAFGAAALGAFSSLPLTYAGGLAVGVASALAAKYIGNVDVLRGLPSSIPFLVLFVTLLVLPKGKLVEAGRSLVAEPARRHHSDPRAVRVGLVVLVAAVAAVPWVVGSKLPVYTNALVFVLVFLSLRLLVRTSGQVSLCHAAFAAVGASTFSHFTTGLGLPWGVALLAAGLVTVPVGAVVAVPAIRLSGLYLAVATFGFGILIEGIFYPMDVMFGAFGSRPVPRPSLPFLDLTTDRAYYYVVAAVVGLACLAVVAIHRSRLGRLLVALADSPTALVTHGTNVNATRVLVFCISAFMAGVAGGLFGGLTRAINGVGFGPFQSLMWLAVLALAPNTPLASAFVASIALAVIPSYVTNDTLIDVFPVLFGLAALTNGVVATRSGGVGPTWQRLVDGARARATRSPARARVEERPA